MPLTPTPTQPLLFVQAILGYEWASAGLEKITQGTFSTSIVPTLSAFAAKNPHQWYAANILPQAIAHAPLLAELIQWGELLVGAALLSSALASFLRPRITASSAMRITVLVACAGGLLMNANFYVAAGWMSPSTRGLNALMFWTQVAILWFWAKKHVPPSPSLVGSP
jgi:hypothetical protein